MIHKDWPPELPESGASRESAALKVWEAAHPPTLTISAWVGPDGKTMASLHWASDVRGTDAGEATLMEMLRAALCAYSAAKTIVHSVAAASMPPSASEAN